MTLKKTSLNLLCHSQGARMINFAGWEMPIQFDGVINEHKAVREDRGIFDISHMGVLQIKGPCPKHALQRLVPSDLNRIGPGEACYTVLLNDRGCIEDDVIIYDTSGEDEEIGELIMVTNASRENSDLKLLEKHLKPAGICISDIKGDGVFISIQGPKAVSTLEEYFQIDFSGIPRFGHKKLFFNEFNHPFFLARTGYTGEDGAEILLKANDGKKLWSKLLNYGVTPCGLGARNTLRLEAAMHLYGNDMNSSTNPFEASLGWLVHLEMPFDFLGRKTLEKVAANGPQKKLVGIQLSGRSIARENYRIYAEGKEVGVVTSGSWSPTLNISIALATVPPSLAKIGTKLKVGIRGKHEPAVVVKRPFYRCS